MSLTFPFRWVILAATLLLAVSACKKDNPDDNPDDNPGVEYDHLRGVGESSVDLINGDTYDELLIELIYDEDYQPEQASIDNMVAFLEAVLDKPGGVRTIWTKVTLPGQSAYTISEVRALETDLRTEYTRDKIMAASFLFMDGEFDQSGSGTVLGVAYRNTSMALFGSSIEAFSGGLGKPSQTLLETTVINHEVGHILGLVNNNLAMVTNHEDSDHPGHCNNEDCLMFWLAETGDFASNLLGMSQAPTLDQNCLNDIAAVR